MMRLPNKLSACIRVALADLRKVEADERYRVDMATWHTPIGDRCAVCLAGAVMAGTLGLRHGVSTYPGAFGNDTADRLYALDACREGDVQSAIEYVTDAHFDVDTQYAEARRVGDRARASNIDMIAEYDEDPERFHADMSSLADWLEAEGY